MKFTCHKCSCYLGEMDKGKLKNGAVLLCKSCIEKYTVLESLDAFQKSTGGNKYDMPDFFKDIFKGVK